MEISDQEFLDALVKESKATDETVCEKFLGLSAEQINWRPDKATWSIGQQFHHMLLTNRPYVEIFRTMADAAAQPKKSYSPSFLGGQICKAAGPDGGTTVPVPGPLRPTESPVSPKIVQEYLDVMAEFDGVVEDLKGTDLNAKFSSPIAKFLKMKLGDGVKITVVHNQRHVQSALKLLTRSEFPR